ncbi:hypothetical protein IW261DRAFT_1519830 [Armillaria novae-zelandiae]|uniref:Uncharacterized protein n=1 Tax=Armillaria novae-zelandiae TaxID=153914 RepID=A0AA39NKW2_9AGAR|nr:hypothetical protein IW261DRAFT_1519830 [Armillaria novae-zelandiae]
MAGFHDFTRRSGEIRHLRRSDDNCSTGGFYISPARGAVVDSLKSTNITWDPSCVEVNAVDIHLYAPSMPNPMIYVWEQVKNADGTYEATLKPRWWNSSSTIQLQLVILPSGNPPFLATLPAGPLWNATYTQPESGTPDSADTSEQGPASEVVGSASSSKAISAGQIAAAVVAPVVFIILCTAAWLVWRRRKGLKERKAWTEAVDRRMSTTTDWPSITVAGASAAIRNSLVGTPRTSMGSRPSSSFYAGSGNTGVGAGLYHHANERLTVSPLSSNQDGSIPVGTGESKLLNIDARDAEILTPEMIKARVSDGGNWWAISGKKNLHPDHGLRPPPKVYRHPESDGESFRGMLNAVDHTQTMGPDDMMRAYAYRG